MEKTLLSFLAVTASVILVHNDTVDGNPLVTPLVDKQTGSPKTDVLGNELGSIRLEQHTRDLNGSYLNARRRVAFIGGSLEQLQKLVSDNKLVNGSQIPGKIIIKESLEPMWKGQTPKMNPQSAEQIGVTVNEKFFPVYMQMLFTEDMNKQDTLIRTPEDVNAWFAVRSIAASTNAAVVNQPAVPTV